MSVMMGAHDEDTVSSLAGRLARLEKQLEARDQQRITEQTGGIHLNDIIGRLIAAIDPDRVDNKARESARLMQEIAACQQQQPQTPRLPKRQLQAFSKEKRHEEQP